MADKIEDKIKEAVITADTVAEWVPTSEDKDIDSKKEANLKAVTILAIIDEANNHLKNGRYVKTADALSRARKLVSEL